MDNPGVVVVDGSKGKDGGKSGSKSGSKSSSKGTVVTDPTIITGSGPNLILNNDTMACIDAFNVVRLFVLYIIVECCCGMLLALLGNISQKSSLTFIILHSSSLL